MVTAASEVSQEVRKSRVKSRGKAEGKSRQSREAERVLEETKSLSGSHAGRQRTECFVGEMVELGAVNERS
jgi:hypothetical protein